MTQEEKQELYKPKEYDLFENGIYVCTFPSHSEAKKVKHQKIKEIDHAGGTSGFDKEKLPCSDTRELGARFKDFTVTLEEE